MCDSTMKTDIVRGAGRTKRTSVPQGVGNEGCVRREKDRGERYWRWLANIAVQRDEGEALLLARGGRYWRTRERGWIGWQGGGEG